MVLSIELGAQEDGHLKVVLGMCGWKSTISLFLSLKILLNGLKMNRSNCHCMKNMNYAGLTIALSKYHVCTASQVNPTQIKCKFLKSNI